MSEELRIEAERAKSQIDQGLVASLVVGEFLRRFSMPKERIDFLREIETSIMEKVSRQMFFGSADERT